MSDKSEERGLVSGPKRSAPPPTTSRVQRGNVPSSIPQQVQDQGSLQQRGPIRAKRSSVY